MGTLSWLTRFVKRDRSESTASSNPPRLPVAEALEDRRLFAATITKFQFVVVGNDVDNIAVNNSRVFQEVSAAGTDSAQTNTFLVHVGRLRSRRTGKLPNFDLQVDTNLSPAQATTVSFDLVGTPRRITRVERIKPYSVRGGRPLDRDNPSGPTIPYNNGIALTVGRTYTLTARLGGQTGRFRIKFKVVE